MRQKYFFISYVESGTTNFYNKVINDCPLAWQLANSQYKLIAWQEITQEDYEDHNVVFNEQG